LREDFFVIDEHQNVVDEQVQHEEAPSNDVVLDKLLIFEKLLTFSQMPLDASNPIQQEHDRDESQQKAQLQCHHVCDVESFAVRVSVLQLISEFEEPNE
jgi:hypothetical protein